MRTDSLIFKNGRLHGFDCVLNEQYAVAESDIAKILNVSQVAYSFYEIGKRQIPIDLLIKLAKYYNTSTDYLLELTDERKPYSKSLKEKNK